MDIARNTLARPSVCPANAAQNAGIRSRRRILARVGRRAELVGVQRPQRGPPAAVACARTRSSRPDLSTQLRQHVLAELSRPSNPERHAGVCRGLLTAKPGCAGDSDWPGFFADGTGLERSGV